ncbi:hypothetical protein LPJ64_001081 [Coemansia asiatica]|uniref:Mediator of RNA polymerase II transcription subunit 8 n=1 Tax=Coemansia asiatica TaxID=1052880 RepID=A0A9W8CME4_9FUNG|nr:hypothetical protein LPJ64_001081 [Coemansia asiatica]
MSDANIVELETLRRQLQQLHESFTAVINETRPTPDNPSLISWPDLLSKFNILAAKYAVLNQAVGKKHAKLLKEMAVAPKTRPGSIHEQNIISVLLRTKLAPEIEQEEERIWARVEAESQQDKRLDWSARAEKHESLAISALNTFIEQRRRHASTVEELVRQRQRHSQSVAQGEEDEEDGDVEMEQSGGANEGETEAAAAVAATGAVALEDVLGFVSSGAGI